MAENFQGKKILTKPLPQILDEIEESIKSADEAAKNAREASIEARQAGDRAFTEATRVANERIDKVELIAKNALQLAELIKMALVNGMLATNNALSENDSSAKHKPVKNE